MGVHEAWVCMRLVYRRCGGTVSQSTEEDITCVQTITHTHTCAQEFPKNKYMYTVFRFVNIL